MSENPSGDFKAMYRHISKGSWTFSMHDQGWQVSDCTAEGLKARVFIKIIIDIDIDIYINININMNMNNFLYYIYAHA